MRRRRPTPFGSPMMATSDANDAAAAA
jgi:hypothetical protein